MPHIWTVFYKLIVWLCPLNGSSPHEQNDYSIMAGKMQAKMSKKSKSVKITENIGEIIPKQ